MFEWFSLVRIKVVLIGFGMFGDVVLRCFEIVPQWSLHEPLLVLALFSLFRNFASPQHFLSSTAVIARRILWCICLTHSHHLVGIVALCATKEHLSTSIDHIDDGNELGLPIDKRQQGQNLRYVNRKPSEPN